VYESLASGSARTEAAGRIEALRVPGPDLLDRLPGMAYQCRNDTAWTMEFVSGGCRTLTGYDPTDLIGPGSPSYSEIIHPDDRERVWRDVQRALASGEPVFELRYRIVKAEGDVRDVWEQGHPVLDEDGVLLGLEGFVTDVTEFRHASRKLAASEAILHPLIEQGLAGVYVIRDGLFRSVNAAFAEIFGYTVDEIEGRLGPFDLAAEEDRERVAEAVRRRLEGGEPAIRYEFDGLRKDGSRIRIEAHGSRIELGGKNAIAGILIDLTERRALAEQLRHSQRVEGLGELTGAIAHDFNNYLTAIIAPMELALQDVDLGDPCREELLRARETALRAASLTRQLLSFGRKRVYSPRPVSVNEVLENAREMLDQLTGPRIEVSYRLEGALPAVVADPGHLQQIFVNLVINARDAIEGLGTIEVGTRTELVEPSRLGAGLGLEPGTYAALWIRDDGEGMDPETVKRIFDPYFTTKEAGTGLGLSTVHGIVKQHGGDLHVESAPGRGTQFTVLLPTTDRAPVPTRERRREVPRISPDTQEGGTILVVEDEEAVRRVIVAALRRFGFHVLAAGDGKGALAEEEAWNGEIELLITDLMLPDLTGLELADTMRDRRPELPILLMSGYAPAEVRRDRIQGRRLYFLEKPFMIDQLLSTMSQALEGSPRWRREFTG